MDDPKYNLIFTGELIEGKDPEAVYEKIASLFKTDSDVVRKKFSRGQTVVSRNVARNMGERMLSALTDAGANCRLEPVVDAPSSPPPQPVPPRPERKEPEPAPVPPANPYAAPKADLRTPTHGGEDGFTDPIRVPASRGAAWIMQAFGLILKSPLGWFLSMLIFFAVNLVQIIPIIGSLVTGLLGPVFMAGLVQGAKELDDDEELRPACVFYGFKTNFGRLIGFSLVFIVSVIIITGVIFGIMAALFGFNLAMFKNPQAMAGSSVAMIALFPLIALLIAVPVMMCYWFAPALILINDQSVFEAIKLSFSGCMKNWLAFLINGLVLIGVGLVAGIVIGVLGALSGAILGKAGPAIAGILGMLIMAFLVMPVFVGVLYASYRDIFYE